LGKLAELRDSGIPIYFFVEIMICGWKIISRRNEHSCFHDNQEYTFGDKTFLLVTETEPGDLG
jgi:UDP-2,3-diacylglucosamine hydrolase